MTQVKQRKRKYGLYEIKVGGSKLFYECSDKDYWSINRSRRYEKILNPKLNFKMKIISDGVIKVTRLKNLKKKNGLY